MTERFGSNHERRWPADTPPATSASERKPLVLSMTGMSKRFLGVPGLIDAEFQVARGEVHALVGQNGAGKSSLIKVLTGVYKRDAGEIVFDGRRVDFCSPHEAQLGGLSTIYQEVNLVGYRSIAE